MTTKAKLLDSVSRDCGATGSSTIPRPTDNFASGGFSRLNRMFRLRDLPEFVGLRRTQIGELIKSGGFPKPVPLSDSGRAVAWLEADLIAGNMRGSRRATPAARRATMLRG